MSKEERRSARRLPFAIGRGGWLGAATCAAFLFGPVAGSGATLAPTNADGQIEVILKEHRFMPSEIHVPAGKRIQILLKNQDATADEFDSTTLKVEKVVGGGSESVIRLRELDPGRYPFMGEFHSETAQGVVVAE